MPRSTVKKGNYYRQKTKKWFQDEGYYAEYLEKHQRIFSKGKVIFINRDIAGSDGFAMKADPPQLIFWQCKLRKVNIASALKEFAKFPFPHFVERWVVVWTPRQREPDIIKYEEKKED